MNNSTRGLLRIFTRDETRGFYQRLFERLVVAHELPVDVSTLSGLVTLPQLEELPGHDSHIPTASILMDADALQQAYSLTTLKSSQVQVARYADMVVSRHATHAALLCEGEALVSLLRSQGALNNDLFVAFCGAELPLGSLVMSVAQAGAYRILAVSEDKVDAARELRRVVAAWGGVLDASIFTPSPEPNKRGFDEAYRHTHFQFGGYDSSQSALREADVVVALTPQAYDCIAHITRKDALIIPWWINILRYSEALQVSRENQQSVASIAQQDNAITSRIKECSTPFTESASHACIIDPHTCFNAYLAELMVNASVHIDRDHAPSWEDVFATLSRL